MYKKALNVNMAPTTPVPPALSQIARKSLKESVIEQIRAAITRGELRAGDQVTELGLAKKLGVSQPTVREALIELEHQGYIQRQSPRKTFVTVLSKSNIQQIYVVRIKLETLAVELLAGSSSPDLSECEAAYRRMAEAADAADSVAFSHADLDFHRKLWRATGNAILADLLEQLVPRLFAFFLIQRAVPDRESLQRTAGVHWSLIEAMRAGDKVKACAIMEASLKQALAEDSELPGREKA
jgi:DNA-binding GntR family transcriptional regulator